VRFSIVSQSKKLESPKSGAPLTFVYQFGTSQSKFAHKNETTNNATRKNK
jgi:hypothetical protein